jgi:threonine dehydratase
MLQRLSSAERFQQSLNPPIISKVSLMSDPFFETAANAVKARNRIREHIYQTPLIPTRKVGQDHGANVLFKAENFQLTGSFKLRGAMSKMSAHAADGPLITASSGNHGIGAALAARTLSKKLVVVLPETVVPAKLERSSLMALK